MDEAWQQQKYDQVYENTLEHIEEQKRSNPDFTFEQLNRKLANEYSSAGRGDMSEVAEITSAATIAAYQAALVEWQKELGAV